MGIPDNGHSRRADPTNQAQRFYHESAGRVSGGFVPFLLWTEYIKLCSCTWEFYIFQNFLLHFPCYKIKNQAREYLIIVIEDVLSQEVKLKNFTMKILERYKNWFNASFFCRLNIGKYLASKVADGRLEDF